MKNEKKLNNKGFSLVELIIVIAIMAVLIGVLAPQYMRYVERSRVSADRDSVDAMVNALQVYAVDPEAAAAFVNGSSITIGREVADNSISEGTGVSGTPVANALTNAGLPSTAATIRTLENQQTFDQVVITVNINSTTGTFNVTTAYTNGGTAVTF